MNEDIYEYNDYEDTIEEENPIPSGQEVEDIGKEEAEEIIEEGKYEGEEEVKLIDKENKIPITVKNWTKGATEYSRGNYVPSTVCFYSILGDLVKYFAVVPFGKTGQDTRIHFLNIQTARTGKSTLIDYVINPVASILYKKLKDDPYVNSKLFESDSYTTASLIGSFRKNEEYDKYKNDEDLVNTEFEEDMATLNAQRGDISDYEYQKRRKRVLLIRKRKTMQDFCVMGPMHGEGLCVLDEFHESGVFTKKQHSDGIIGLFQNIMNNFHGGGNQYKKNLTDKVGKSLSLTEDEETLAIELDSKFTMLAFTYPPENLENKVEKAGLLQRFLCYILEVSENEIETTRSKITLSAGNYDLYSKSKTNAENLHEDILGIFNLVKNQYENVGKDMTKVIPWHKDSAHALELERRNIIKLIDALPIEMRTVIRLFEMNLVEYIAKIATLNTMIFTYELNELISPIEIKIENIKISLKEEEPKKNEEEIKELEEEKKELEEEINTLNKLGKRFELTAMHIRQAGNVVRPCYMALVEWMENHMSRRRKLKKASKNGILFEEAFKLANDTALPHHIIDGGYIWKTLVLEKAIKIGKKTLPTVNKAFNKLQGNESGTKKEGKTEIYDVIKIGKQEYIKPKEE